MILALELEQNSIILRLGVICKVFEVTQGL